MVHALKPFTFISRQWSKQEKILKCDCTPCSHWPSLARDQAAEDRTVIAKVIIMASVTF